MKVNPPTNRLIGDMPKIGIRPTIDGRLGGVRESLEELTMDMAKNVAKFLSENLRHYNGLPVECVIADRNIGGVAEAAACAEKFRREGVGVSLTVTPCWCYGSETMDMDPHLPKAVWGFNGTERPGAVYLAAVSAAHNQKGLPVFSIYGRDVQDVGDESIPEDVQVKLLQFAKAGLAVASMRGKSYLSMGGTSMGIGGSIVDQDLFEDYLGMRVEVIDMVEFVRRMEEGIYDADEFEKALAWVKENCPEGKDYNPAADQQSREVKDEVWATSVKMALIARDLMVGNPKLAEMGYGEEAQGHNAIASGFQGQRQWTDHLPNGDFLEAILNSSFDWNGIRPPYIVATENDALNGVSMLLGNLLTNTAQIFADVRTYWSPAAVKRVTGYDLDGVAAGGILHLINSGPATLDGTGQMEKDGKPAMKPFWEITPKEAKACLDATTWHAGMLEYFRAGGWSTALQDPRRHAGDHVPHQPGQGAGPGHADRRGLDRGAARRGPRHPRRAHQPDLADDLVRAAHERRRPLPRRLHRHEQLGRQPRGHQLRPHRHRPDDPLRHAAHPGLHAQRGRRDHLPPQRLGRVRSQSSPWVRTSGPVRRMGRRMGRA